MNIVCERKSRLVYFGEADERQIFAQMQRMTARTPKWERIHSRMTNKQRTTTAPSKIDEIMKGKTKSESKGMKN